MAAGAANGPQPSCQVRDQVAERGGISLHLTGTSWEPRVKRWHSNSSRNYEDSRIYLERRLGNKAFKFMNERHRMCKRMELSLSGGPFDAATPSDPLQAAP